MKTKDFSKVIQDLEKQVWTASTVYELSNLLAEEMSQLQRVWPTLSAERRSEIIEQMVQVAEADVEVCFDPIFVMCLKDADPRVRALAVEGLWENEDVQLIRPLVGMLRADESPLVREAAAISLSRFALLAELARLQPRLSEMVWEALWQTIHNAQEEIDVRRRAIESLAYFGQDEVRQVIERAYRHEEPRMRASAVFAMGRSADEEWSEIVMGELDASDPEMRYEAARACGALQITEAVPGLSRIVADPDAEIKLMAVWALGQIGGSEARRVLEICYEQDDEALQEAADEALSEIDFIHGALDFTMYDFGEDRD